MILKNQERLIKMLEEAVICVNKDKCPIYLAVYSNNKYELSDTLKKDAVYNFEILEGFDIDELLIELDFNLSFF
jgi:hypothetical protein